MEESERTLQSETTETTAIPDELVLKTTINEEIFNRNHCKACGYNHPPHVICTAAMKPGAVFPTPTEEFDVITKPRHYTEGLAEHHEPIVVMEAWGLLSNAYLWNVVKYIARHKKKGDELENLKKAKYYLDREIERRERERQSHHG